MPIKLTRVTDIGLPSTTGNRLKVTLSQYTEQPYNRGELSHDFDDGGDLLTLVDINDNRTLFKDVSYSNIINGNTGLYFESGVAVKAYLNNFEGTPDTQYVTVEYFNQVVAALQAQIAQGGGGSLSDYYTKDEIDQIVASLNSGDLSGYYTREQIDQLFADMASGGTVDLSNYFTKTQVNDLLAAKADGADLNNYYSKAETATLISNALANYYTQSQVNAELAKKVDKQTGYGLTQNNYPNADKAKVDLLAFDNSNKIAASILPSYVDDVLEFATLSAFPVTGESGKIYIALDTNKTYRWGGSAYVEITASPGSTDAVSEGSTNQYFTQGRVRSTPLTGLDNTLTGVPSAADTILSFAGKVANFITGIAATVRGTVLTGLSTVSATAVLASDSILVAIGKLQAQASAAVTQTALDTKQDKYATTKTITDATYALLPTDHNNQLNFTVACVVTIPLALPVGFQVVVKQKGTGQVSFLGVGGITIESQSGFAKTSGQFAMAWVGADTSTIFTLSGSLTA